ncbi:MAG: gliding motility protein GldL [Saprospiraceae bacterium]|nr:gliding motility protein GldL [Saprospiraceae bacterium]
MAFYKSSWFKYLKNLIIGVGAAIVMLGALFKIQSWEGGGLMLTIGLCTEAFLFTLLGLLPPEKDYYWEKLYPGLEKYDSTIAPITEGEAVAAINGEVVEQQLGGMLNELQSMSKSLGSLKALQEVDFAGTSEQVAAMSNFYTRMNEAMGNLSDSLEDTVAYKDQLAALNKNLGSLNNVYGNVLTAMSNIGGNN